MNVKTYMKRFSVRRKSLTRLQGRPCFSKGTLGGGAVSPYQASADVERNVADGIFEA